jgi:hypothetical protein
MPEPSALPDSIRDFSFRNAAEVDQGRDFHQHMERVERAIDDVLRRRKPRLRIGPVTTSVIAATVAIALGLAGWIIAPRLYDSGGRHTPVAAQQVKGPAPGAPTNPNPAAGISLRRAALVIGNANYQRVPKLATPVNDATAMAAGFKSAGFDIVITKLDVGNLDFKRALREFADAADSADISVIYFSGHGIAVGETNYLVPVDAVLAHDDDAMDEAVAMDRLLLYVQSAKILPLLIMDACRDNPFAATMKRSSRVPLSRQGLERTEPTPGTLIAYAAKGGSASVDGDGPNSIYVTALLQHLFVPGLDIRLAFGRIHDAVLNATNKRQEPFVYGSLGGTPTFLAAGN